MKSQIPSVWSIAEIADAIESALADAARRHDREQSVRGLDALDELSTHPLLARGLSAAGYGVFGEQHYPTEGRRRRDNEGERCDLVLTPGGQDLYDPSREPTLFDPPDAVALDEAFWLEVKVVCQFTPEGPNQRYASQLLSTVREDVTKLSRNRGIRHSGLLIILFAEDRSTAEHDLAAWLDRCLQRGLPVGSPSMRLFEITDRLGNGVCAVALYPVAPDS
ncbi:MAG: hypothetical protein ACYS15_07990 [Planctomycetota bacterium]